MSETKRMYGLVKSDYEGFEGDWICLILLDFLRSQLFTKN